MLLVHFIWTRWIKKQVLDKNDPKTKTNLQHFDEYLQEMIDWMENHLKDDLRNKIKLPQRFFWRHQLKNGFKTGFGEKQSKEIWNAFHEDGLEWVGNKEEELNAYLNRIIIIKGTSKN